MNLTSHIPNQTNRPTRSPFALALLLVIAGCASTPSDPAGREAFDRANDPIEPTNRAIFAANQFVDRNALKPIATGYRSYVPGRAQRSIHSFVDNLGEPAIAVNDVLQGNLTRAATTIGRFATNTTLGGAGLFDVATDWDMPHHTADFGQTLGVWGVGPGPAVQLPLFGPSNVRDTVGKVGGLVTDPLGLITAGTFTVIKGVASGAGVVDGRATLLPTTDSLEKSSLDYYAALRSASAQRRAALVAEGKSGGSPGPVDRDKTQPIPAISPQASIR